MSFSEALTLARQCVTDGSITEFWTEREGGGTGGARIIFARCDQGDYVFWNEADEDY